MVSDHGMFNHQSKGYCVKEKGGRRGEVGEMVGGISFGWGCQEKYSHTRLHLHTHIYADHIISGGFNTDIVE